MAFGAPCKANENGGFLPAVIPAPGRAGRLTVEGVDRAVYAVEEPVVFFSQPAGRGRTTSLRPASGTPVPEVPGRPGLPRGRPAGGPGHLRGPSHILRRSTCRYDSVAAEQAALRMRIGDLAAPCCECGWIWVLVKAD